MFVSNESEQDVYFDDLTITHTTGPLQQEQAYYPYGLQMAGLSDKAALRPTNPYKYNGGNMLEDEDGINYYNTFYRKYDAQIGRFTGIDIMAEQFSWLSPYNFGACNPVFYNDPNGDLITAGSSTPINPASFGNARDLIDHLINNGIDNFDDGWMAWTFDDGGGTSSFFQATNFGFANGMVTFNYSYEVFDGTAPVWNNTSKGGEGGVKTTMNTFVLGKGRVAPQHIWNNALAWGEKNRISYKQWLNQKQAYDVMWKHNNDVYMDRRNRGAPVSRAGDRASYTESLASMSGTYQAKMDGRARQIAALAILTGPMAMEALPAISELYILGRDVSHTIQVYTQIGLTNARFTIYGGAALHFAPLSETYKQLQSWSGMMAAPLTVNTSTFISIYGNYQTLQSYFPKLPYLP